MTALEGVSKIDWGALEHANGSAESVLPSLEALANGNAKERGAAIADLLLSSACVRWFDNRARCN